MYSICVMIHIYDHMGMYYYTYMQFKYISYYYLVFLFVFDFRSHLVNMLTYYDMLFDIYYVYLIKVYYNKEKYNNTNIYKFIGITYIYSHYIDMI